MTSNFTHNNNTTKNWIIMQLSEKGEIILEEEPFIIENLLKRLVGPTYFLPLYYDKTKNYDNKIFLFKGYIFIEYIESNLNAYSRLTQSPYFIGPLVVNKKMHLLPEEQIKKMKRQMTRLIRPLIKIGDKVKILDGKYRNLEATVSEYYKKEKEADLAIELKCMNIIVPRIPIVNLKNLSKEEKNKDSLQEKVLELLREFSKGLTRKEIIHHLTLEEKEKLRLSTCLTRAVQKEQLFSKLNEANHYVFLIKN